MSNKVDERITRIRFDNDQFERGVSTSMQSLDRLKNKLESTESINAFSGMSSAVESISKKFTTLHMVAVDVLGDITSKAISAGSALIKSLSVDNIIGGWTKYNQEVSAVQAIMHTLGDTASIEDVEEHLKYLAWYSDETSYSYDQMTNALGRFVNNGADLNDATKAMTGLANAAASAGVSTSNTQSIFEAMSNAYARGYVMLNDWRRLEAVLLPTPEIKQQIMDIAVALGKVQKIGDDLYHANGYKEDFTSGGLASSLTKGKWFDKDVIMAFSNLYGEFSNQVYEFQQLFEIETASSAMTYMRDLGSSEFQQRLLKTAASLGKIYEAENGVFYLTDKMLSKDKITVSDMLYSKWLDADVLDKALNKYSKISDETLNFIDSKGLKSIAEAVSYLNEAGVSLDSVSAKAFVMGQEAKTLSEALDSVRDAVSTKWKDTFKALFGNYNEAKVLWTDLANELYDLFAASGDTRNAILEMWNNPKELFKPTEADIWDLFDDRNLQSGRDMLLESLWNIFESIKNVVDAIKEAWRAVFPQITAERLYYLTDSFRDFTARLKDSTENLDGFKAVLRFVFNIIKSILNVFKKLFNIVKEIWPVLKKIGEIVISVLKQVFQFFKDATEYTRKWDKTRTILDKIADVLKKVKDAILGIDASKIKLPTFDEFVNAIKNVDFSLDSLRGKVTSVFSVISNWFSNIINKRKELTADSEDGELFTLIPTKSGGELNNVRGFFNEYLSIADSTGSKISGFTDRIKQILGGTFTWVQNQFADFHLDDLISIGVLWVVGRFVYKLGDFADNLGSIFAGISNTISALAGVLNSLSGLIKAKTFTETTKAIKNFAVSILAIAGAIYLLASIKEGMADAIEVVSNIAIALVFIQGLLSWVNGLTSKKSFVSITGFNLSGFNMTRNGGTGAGGLIGLSLAILSMVLAFKWMVKITTGVAPDRIQQVQDTVISLGWALTGMVVVLNGVQALASRYGGENYKRPGSFAPLGMALGILTMIRVFKQLDSMEIKNVGNIILGLISILSIMGAMGFLFRNISAGVGIGMLGLIGSMWLTLLLIKRFETLDVDFSEGGLIFLIVSGLFTLIAFISRFVMTDGIVLSQGQKFKRFHVNFIGIIAMLYACIGAVHILASMELGQLLQGGIATIILMGGLFAGLTVMIAQLNKAGEHAGKGLGKIAILMFVIGLVVGEFAVISRLAGWQHLAAAGAVVIAILGVLILVIRSLSSLTIYSNSQLAINGLKDLARVIVAITALIGIMTYLLRQDPVNTLLAIGLVFLLLFALGSSMKNMETVLTSKTTIWQIVKILGLYLGILAEIGVIVSLLSYFTRQNSWKEVLSSAAAIGAIGYALSKSVQILGKMPEVTKNMWHKFGVLAAITAVLAGIVIGLSWAMKPSTEQELAVAVASISALGLVVSLVSLVLTAIPNNINAQQIIGQLSLFTGIAMALGLLVTALSWIVNGDNLAWIKTYGVQLLAMVGVLTGLTLLFGFLGQFMNPAGVLTGVAAFGIVTAAFTIFATLLFGIIELIKWICDKSGLDIQTEIDQCISLAYGLGSIISALYAGVFVGAAPMVAESLSGFAKNLEPFIDVVSKIPDGFGKGLTELGRGILSFSWNDLWTNVVQFFGGTGSNNVENLNSLTPLFEPGGLFYAMSNLSNTGSMEAGMDIIERLPDAVKGINGIKTDKINEVFGGLNALSEKVVEFSNNLGMVISKEGFNVNAISMIATGFENLGKAMGNFFEENGVVKDFDGVGQEITSIGLVMHDFNDFIKDLSPDSLRKTMLIKSICNTLLSIKPNIGLNIGNTATTDLSTFGGDVAAFLENGMASYISAINALSVTDIGDAQARTPKIADIIKKLSTISDVVGKNGGIKGVFSGTDYSKFGKDIKQFAKHFKTYISEITDSKIDWTNAEENTGKLLAIISRLSDARRTMELEQFVTALKDLATNAITGFITKLTSEETKQKITDAMNAVATFMKSAVSDYMADAKAVGADIAEFYGPFLNSIKDFLLSKKNDFAEWGKSLWTSFLSGVTGKSTLNEAKTIVKKHVKEAVLEPSSDVLGIHSPSKEFEKLGEYSVEGYALGFTNPRSNKVMIDAIERFSNVATETMEESTSGSIRHFGEEVSEEVTETGNNVKNGWEKITEWLSNGAKGLGEQAKKWIGDPMTGAIGDVKKALESGDWQSLVPEEIKEMFNPESFGSYDSYVQEFQKQFEEYSANMPTMDLGINPVLTDEYGTYANWQDALNGTGLSTTLNYGTEIPQLTQAIIRLEDRVAVLSDALRNQTMTHSGEISLRYANSDDLTNHIQSLIIDSVRREIRG